MKATCERYMDRATDRPDYPAPGGYWSVTLDAIAHLCEAYCRADTSNQPRVVGAIVALLGGSTPHGRMEEYALRFIEFNLGGAGSGGRGDELIKDLFAYRAAT